tara:strand:- start:4569 stop:6104 length:1536 start_codon:yes stop_codon:yes gene_type:complete
MSSKQAALFSLLIILSFHPIDSFNDDNNQQFHSDNMDFSDPPLLGFDHDLGITLAGNYTISGFTVSSTLPDSSDWQIIRLSDDGISTNVTNPTYLEMSPSASNQDDGLSRWVWEFTINSSSITNCTCFITVTATANHQSSSITSVFFTGVTNVPALVVDDWAILNDEYRTYSEKIDISGRAFDQNNLPVDVLSMAVRSDNYANACSDYPEISSFDDISGSSEQSISNFSSFGQFSETVDSSMLEDGWYSLWLFSSPHESSSITQSLCFVSKIDNSDPVAIIEGDMSSMEGDGDLIFDAGSSYDQYWGKDGLNYVWTLVSLQTSGNVLMENKEGGEFSYFTVRDDISGNFELSLLVYDVQGNTDYTSIAFSIENLPPVAKLVVSEQPLSDGDNFKLPDLGEWTLDASDSIDTTNDLEGLRCVWKINFRTIYEGCERTLAWPEGDTNDTLLLTLEVIDDDDDFSTITVELSQSDEGNDFPIAIILLIISILFFVSSIFYSRRTDDMQIPKWND